jgi:transposase
MIAISPTTRCMVALEPIDFRCGIDSLGGFVRETVRQDPMSGALFVFRNRKKTAIKILCYDGQGFWLCQKRLSVGRFRHWPVTGEKNEAWLCARELQVLLWNGNPTSAAFSSSFNKFPLPE